MNTLVVGYGHSLRFNSVGLLDIQNILNPLQNSQGVLALLFSPVQVNCTLYIYF